MEEAWQYLKAGVASAVLAPSPSRGGDPFLWSLAPVVLALALTSTSGAAHAMPGDAADAGEAPPGTPQPFKRGRGRGRALVPASGGEEESPQQAAGGSGRGRPAGAPGG